MDIKKQCWNWDLEKLTGVYVYTNVENFELNCVKLPKADYYCLNCTVRRFVTSSTGLSPLRSTLRKPLIFITQWFSNA